MLMTSMTQKEEGAKAKEREKEDTRVYNGIIVMNNEICKTFQDYYSK